MNNTLPATIPLGMQGIPVGMQGIPVGMQGIPVGMQDYVHAYFGMWAMADLQFEGLRAMARSFDLNAHLARLANQRRASEQLEEEDEPSGEQREAQRVELHRKATMAALPGLEPAGAFDGYITADGIAVIELRGTLMKFASSFSGGTSTTRARRAIREAVADSRVQAILLVVDSPGGTVSGTPELADEVAAANSKKPVWAYAEDLMASAAYWVSSQSARIGANRTAMVGSTGTIMVLYDYSAAFEEAGIEPKVFKTGRRKGAGTMGSEISTDDEAYFQSLIQECNTHFKSAVVSGRPKVNAEEIFLDAAVYLAADAKSRHLVDQVCTLEAFYAALMKSVAKPGSAPRAEEETTPVSAQDDTTPAFHEVVDDERVSMPTPSLGVRLAERDRLVSAVRFSLLSNCRQRRS